VRKALIVTLIVIALAALLGGWVDGYRHAAALVPLLPFLRLKAAMLFDSDGEDWVEGHELVALDEDA
jgi:hypothetical protein